MVSKPFLRIILSVLFCLNGSTALWASTGMALNPTHMQPAAPADNAGHLSHDSGCAPSATPCDVSAASTDAAHSPGHHEGHDSGHSCWCGIAFGCSCHCAYHGMTVHTVPFEARHRPPSTRIPYAETHAPRRGSNNIFRPPIA